VDGGISAANVRRIVDAGADMIVAGSAIFAAKEGVSAAMRKFRAALA
jgi:ribulose-phosphate 3-epimerase